MRNTSMVNARIKGEHMNKRKKNIILFVILSLFAILWGIAYWIIFVF